MSSVSSNFDSKVSKWSKNSLLSWTDPDNWGYSSKAVPHLERLPCIQDTVILPSIDRTFSVQMPDTFVEIKEIRLDNDNDTLDTWEWNNMADRKEFKGEFTVR